MVSVFVRIAIRYRPDEVLNLNLELYYKRGVFVA